MQTIGNGEERGVTDSYHRRVSEIAAAQERRRKPDKLWRNPARHKCGICGGIIEVGELIGHGSRPSQTRHENCPNNGRNF